MDPSGPFWDPIWDPRKARIQVARRASSGTKVPLLGRADCWTAGAREGAGAVQDPGVARVPYP